MTTSLGYRALAVREQLPLSYTSNKVQRCVFELRLKTTQTAGEAHHENAAVAGEQTYHRRFIRQQSIAKPLEVARKLKGYLVESHAAEKRPVGCGNDGTGIERKALGQPAPTDERVTWTPCLF